MVDVGVPGRYHSWLDNRSKAREWDWNHETSVHTHTDQGSQHMFQVGRADGVTSAIP